VATSSAQEIRNKNRKEVTLPSGNTYLIRKATQRDYVPRGLVTLNVEGVSDDQREETVRKYLAENFEQVLDTENRILVNCVVMPRLVTGEPLDDSTLSVRDLGDDRDPLIAAISEFSGLNIESKKSDDGVGQEELSGPRGDGGVLREAAVGVDQPPA
jgi:hypothetical protein